PRGRRRCQRDDRETDSGDGAACCESHDSSCGLKISPVGRSGERMSSCAFVPVTVANGSVSMEFRILGPLEVADGDATVALGGVRRVSQLRKALGQGGAQLLTRAP